MKRPSRVTIKDVAAAAGVTPTTVSDSLSGKGRLPEETRNRVREVAARLGYRPNALARGLRSKGLGLIGLVIAPAASSTLSTVWYWAAIANHATEAALESGYGLVLLPYSIERLDSMPIPLDGAIVVDPQNSDPVLKHLLSSGASVITVGRDTARDQNPWVDDDNTGGIQQLLDKTVKPGSAIVMVTIEPLKSYVVDTIAGVQRWAKQMGSTVARASCAGLDERSVDLTLDEIMAAEAKVLVAQNDRLAVSLLARLKARGLKVPADLALISATDGPELSHCRPSITALRQHPERLGRLAAITLIDIMHGSPPRAKQLVATNSAIRKSAPALRRKI